MKPPEKCPMCGSDRPHMQVYLGHAYQHGRNAPGWFMPCRNAFHLLPNPSDDAPGELFRMERMKD